MPTLLPPTPKQLRVETLRSRPVSVDLAKEVIYGYVLAQEGPFKTPGRGEFDRDGLRKIVDLTNGERKGLRSRFTHPGQSADGLGKYLGRAKGAWLDTSGPVWRARADLHISPSSHDTPSGDLGGYVLRLANEDPDALSSSVVIEVDEEVRLNKDGTRVKGPNGDPLPPLWRPTKLWATDVVDTGDAVDGLLSAQHLSTGDLPDAVQRQAWAMLDRLFAGQSEETIRARVGDFLGRYLSRHQPAEPPLAAPPPAAPALSPPPAPPSAAPRSKRLSEAKYAADLSRQILLDLLRPR
jgi:hypothetical protein